MAIVKTIPSKTIKASLLCLLGNDGYEFNCMLISAICFTSRLNACRWIYSNGKEFYFEELKSHLLRYQDHFARFYVWPLRNCNENHGFPILTYLVLTWKMQPLFQKFITTLKMLSWVSNGIVRNFLLLLRLCSKMVVLLMVYVFLVIILCLSELRLRHISCAPGVKLLLFGIWALLLIGICKHVWLLSMRSSDMHN